MIDIENFRIRLKEAINYCGLSNNYITKAIGASNGYIGKILSGEHQPSIERIGKIISVLPDINPQWLVFGIGYMRNDNRIISISGSKKPPIKTTNDTTNDTKPENLSDTFEQIQLKESITQYQNMSSIYNQEVEALKKEILTLNERLRDKEERIIELKEHIQTLKNAKFPTQVPMLDHPTV